MGRRDYRTLQQPPPLALLPALAGLLFGLAARSEDTLAVADHTNQAVARMLVTQ